MAAALGGERGGIRGLRDLIRRHGPALEADLRSEYGVRLRDLYNGDLTWRELACYVRGLPPHARVRTALNGGRPEPSVDQLILADLADLLLHLTWTLQAVNAEKGKAPKPPKPYRRWWLEEKPTKDADPARVARIEDARRRARERKSRLAG